MAEKKKYNEFKDRGCAYSPKCIECTREMCIHDEIESRKKKGKRIKFEFNDKPKHVPVDTKAEAALRRKVKFKIEKQREASRKYHEKTRLQDRERYRRMSIEKGSARMAGTACIDGQTEVIYKGNKGVYYSVTQCGYREFQRNELITLWESRVVL